MAAPTHLFCIALAAEANWLQWPVRACSKAVRCDTWAAQVLLAKIHAVTAKTRNRIRVLLKPESVIHLVARLRRASVPSDYQAMEYWLQLLKYSLLDYLAVAQGMTPGDVEGARHDTRFLVQLLRRRATEGRIEGARAPYRALPALCKVAGHLKLCETKMEFLSEVGEGQGIEHDEDLEQLESLEVCLADIDHWILNVQEKCWHL